MKKLIINADDFGADEGRNAGILEAIRAKIVSSVSLLANGTAVEDSLKAIRREDFAEVSIGIHLNLSEGKAVAKKLPFLTNENGAFHGKASTRCLLLREGNGELEKEISKEVDSQIAFLKEAGVSIRHLDGHQHVHLFPGVRRIVIDAAKKYGIHWIRIPRESPPISTEVGIAEALRSEAMFFNDLACAAQPLFFDAGIHTTDHFLGLYGQGRISCQLLEGYVERMAAGLTELMVHPGQIQKHPVQNPFSAFSTVDRVRELEALLAPSFRNTLRRTGVSLIPYPESSL
jgi:predicted glycoside hydrolase/deacetylase ChbG (UPF0249 family)